MLHWSGIVETPTHNEGVERSFMKTYREAGRNGTYCAGFVGSNFISSYKGDGGASPTCHSNNKYRYMSIHSIVNI